MGISGKKILVRELPSKVIDMFNRGSETPALLTLSVHALEGYSSHFVCLSVCLFVCLSVCQTASLSVNGLSRRWRTFNTSKRHELKEYDDLSHSNLPLF